VAGLPRGALLDAGAFVAGLEYAAEADAEVVGKPTAAYFESALADLQASPAEAVMVGDDIEADIGGAKRIGMRAVLVRTGKFRPAALENADPQPDTVIDSIADLPALVDKGLHLLRPPLSRLFRIVPLRGVHFS
jgi:ribonucleotide monophosphatase NagD (HAD superfamily)